MRSIRTNDYIPVAYCLALPKGKFVSEIREIVNIKSLVDGRQEVTYGEILKVTYMELDRIMTDGESVNEVFPNLKTDSPVEGFDEFASY